MAIESAPANFHAQLLSKPLIDLRTQKAHRKNALPGAHSLPGRNFESPKALEKVLKARWPDQECLVYDQSGEFQSLITPLPFVIHLLGGLTHYLEWQSQKYSKGPFLVVLGGKTGAGKTEWLHQLKAAGEQVLDLEAKAQHRGSAFGNLGGAIQPENAQFQYQVFEKWLSFPDKFPVWVEEEGPFLGSNTVPPPLYECMQKAPMIELEVPFEDRLQRILAGYSGEPEAAFIQAIRKLEARMGFSTNHKAIHLYKIGDLEGCFRLLLTYYDTAYETRRRNLRTGKRIPCSGEDLKVENLIRLSRELSGLG